MDQGAGSLVQPGEFLIGLRLSPVGIHDRRADPLALLLVDEPLQAEPHRFGAVGDHPVRDQPIDLGHQIIVQPRHQLRHTISIPKCDAKRGMVRRTQVACGVR